MKPEEVKIFIGNDREIEENYTKWMKEHWANIEITDRKFQTISSNFHPSLICIALFYQEKEIRSYSEPTPVDSI